MKITTFMGLAAAALAAGCAGVQTSTENTSSAAAARTAAGAYYCTTDRLVTDGDHLRCNWYRTQAEACLYSNASVLERSAMTGDPRPAGRCMTGQPVITVTPR